MRLYGMYYICKKYYAFVSEMKVEIRQMTNASVRFIDEWHKKSIVLNELSKLEPLRAPAQKAYDAIPTVYQDQNKFDLDNTNCNLFTEAKKELVASMQAIITLYESMNIKEIDEECAGFDVKLPKFENVKEFSDCLNDLDFIINQCPYLRDDHEQIKYGTVDVGSIWVTFLIVGGVGGILLSNLSKIVERAIKIKSHIATVKAQEEALHTLEMKNEVAEKVFDAFNQANKLIVNQCVDDLQSELGTLKDGEEQDKVVRSLEKLAHWMDKGMQIYSSIDSPAEIKDLFPAQDKITFLTDNIQKLIELKENQ